MITPNETVLEETCLEWLAELGWAVAHGPDLSPDGGRPEREDYGQVLLLGRLRDALQLINPEIPSEGIDDAIKKLTVTESPDMVVNNKQFHRYLN